MNRQSDRRKPAMPKCCLLLRHASTLMASTLAVAMLLSGCSLPPRIVEREPETAADVARVGVVVVAAAPFEIFVKSLKPAFEIDGDKALKMAGATTRQMEDSITDSVQLVAKVAPERVSSERKSTAATDAAGTTTTTSSNARSATAGDVSKVSGPTIPGDKLPDSLSTSGSSGINPILNYQLATALVQEVRMLNDYLSSAPKLAGHTAFVARLQLNVQPLGRNTPYDATVTMTFKGVGNKGGLVTAVPLLMTDSLDITSAAVARRNARSIGLALDLLRGGLGGAFDFGRRTEQLLRAQGTELNSELTVGRGKANNEVAVRIGAIEKGLDKHELVARSHMVTVLLLVPDNLATGSRESRAAPLEVNWVVQFEHARTGDVKLSKGDPVQTKFEAPFWNAPRMPGKQSVQAVLVGKKAPYGVEIALGGGDSLNKKMFDLACLQESDKAGCLETESAVFAKSVDTTDGRNGILVSFEESFAALGDGAQIRLHGAGKSPNFEYICYRPVEGLPSASNSHAAVPSDARQSMPPCLKLTLVYQRTPLEHEPELDATVMTTTQRLVASRDGRASFTLSVAMPEKREMIPDAVEITVGGAGISSVSVLSAKSECVTMTNVIRIVGDCVLNVA